MSVSYLPIEMWNNSMWILLVSFIIDWTIVIILIG